MAMRIVQCLFFDKCIMHRLLICATDYGRKVYLLIKIETPSQSSPGGFDI